MDSFYFLGKVGKMLVDLQSRMDKGLSGGLNFWNRTRGMGEGGGESG